MMRQKLLITILLGLVIPLIGFSQTSSKTENYLVETSQTSTNKIEKPIIKSNISNRFLAPVQTIPFIEDWETNNIGAAWDTYEANYANLLTNTESAYSGTYGLKQYSYSPSGYSIPNDLPTAYLWAIPGGSNEDFTSWIKMSIDLSTSTYPYLTFWYMMGNYQDINYNNFWVQASTDGTTWTDLFATQSNYMEDFEKVELNLGSYNSSSQLFIRFFHNGNYSSNYLYLDDINIEDVSCPNITDQQNTTASNSASLSWTENGAATTWDIEWGDEGFTQGTGTVISGVTTNPYDLQNLNPMSTYDWYVRADCGGGDQSEWEGPDTFTTDCGVMNAPFSDNFDNVDAPDLPDCWSKIIVSSTSWVKVETSNIESTISSPNYVRLYNTYDATAELYFITPQLGDLPTQTNQIRFYAKGNEADCELIIGTMTDPTDESTFSSYTTLTLTEDYEIYTVLFTFDYIENDEYIAFKHGLGGLYRTIYLDNFIYEEAPSCPDPTEQEENNIAPDGAELSWTEVGNETEWNIRIGEQGFDTTNASYSIETSTSITVDTLADNATYDWYVRASCGGGDYSNWVGPSEFTTYCNPITADYSQDFDGVSDPELPDCWLTLINSSSDNSIIETVTYAYPHSEPNHVKIFNSDDANAEMLLITPQFGDLTDQNYQIRFYAKATNPYDLIIGTISDPTDETTFTQFTTITLTTSYIEYEVEFGSSYTESDERIAFKHGQGTAYRTIYIDDFNYEPIPSCKTPVNQSVGNISYTEAEFAWDEAGTSSNWDIYIVGMGGEAPDDTTVPTIDDTDINPYTWSGAESGTTYDWYVRSDCGGNNTDVSTWKGYNTFNTLITNDDCTGAINLPVGYSVDWKQGTNSGATDSNNNPDPVPDPGCASYQGADVWYSATIPSSGYLVITSQRVERSKFTDSGMGVYTGNCGSLALFECNDNDGADGAMSEIIIDDILMANTTIYIRFWCYGNYDAGPFEITAYTKPSEANWTGTTDEDWDNSENWDFDGTPGAITSVTIPVGLSNYPTLTGYAECNDFIIKSDATGTASFIGAEYLNINGETIIERFIAGGEWHGIASPVDGATLESVYSNTYNVWVDEYQEPTDSWSHITSTGTPFPFGKGFNYWVQTASRANLTIEFQGDLRTNNLTLNNTSTPPLIYTDALHGFNQVGNPFISAIDWDEGSWDTTNISGVVWVWQTSSGSSGNYVTRNSQGAGSLLDGIIPMCQAFFVRTTSEAPSLTIPLDSRVHSSHYYKNSGRDEAKYAIFNVSMENATDEVWVTFTEGDTDSYDLGHDAEKLFGSETSPQLYIKQDDIDLSIDALGLLEEDEKVIPLYLKAGVSGDHVLTTEFVGLEDMDVILEDLRLGEMYNLSQNPVYNFNAAYYHSPDRFLIHFKQKITEIDQNHDDLIDIYSNTNVIYIKSNESLATISKQAFVFDAVGRQVLYKKLNPTRLNKIHVKSGSAFYIVKVIADGEVFTSKVFTK